MKLQEYQKRINWWIENSPIAKIAFLEDENNRFRHAATSRLVTAIELESVKAYFKISGVRERKIKEIEEKEQAYRDLCIYVIQHEANCNNPNLEADRLCFAIGVGAFSILKYEMNHVCNDCRFAHQIEYALDNGLPADIIKDICPNNQAWFALDSTSISNSLYRPDIVECHVGLPDEDYILKLHFDFQNKRINMLQSVLDRWETDFFT